MRTSIVSSANADRGVDLIGGYRANSEPAQAYRADRAIGMIG
jgi:hypothetical protein